MVPRPDANKPLRLEHHHPPPPTEDDHGTVTSTIKHQTSSDLLEGPCDGHTDTPTNNTSMECILQPRILTDFSYVEQPVRCLLSCKNQQYYVTGNGRNAVFLKKANGESSQLGDEFVLLPQEGDEGTHNRFLIKNAKTQMYLCSGKEGGVYASRTKCEGMEQWTMTECENSNAGGSSYVISSVVSGRVLACSGLTIQTIAMSGTSSKYATVWNVSLTSGELCFLSLPILDQRVRCNMAGKLSLSDNYLGWEVWRLSEAGGGHVRISPWAHSELYLSSDADGNVCTTETRGSSEVWDVFKAPNGLDGVIIRSVEHGLVLRYDKVGDRLCTGSGKMVMMDEFCVWDFDSLHRRTYYMTTSDNKRYLEANKRGLAMRGLPNRFQSEEWKIETTNRTGVIRLFSNAREQYLISDAEGKVDLVEQSPSDGSDQWIMEERENGFVVKSVTTQRVLVMDQGSIGTVPSGTMVHGNTRWKLEPKLPRQINKEKLQAVGGAVAIGVLGTVATPFLIGGVVGALGVAQVGIAGNIAIGSIRAVEAVNTVTRVTLSSSQLVISKSSLWSTESSKYLLGENQNRPFCAWRDW
mmetsp:Transcript_1759/g.2724  ORF Transcript_1759/g.2724 Transcript_1759/m.2724 type:complete len:580 (+) Transcript_1759:51-1790(+)